MNTIGKKLANEGFQVIPDGSDLLCNFKITGHLDSGLNVLLGQGKNWEHACLLAQVLCAKHGFNMATLHESPRLSTVIYYGVDFHDTLANAEKSLAEYESKNQ